MKVTGSATLSAPREQVWTALNDPAVLARTIPGCQQLEETGADAYRMTVTAGVAAIKGTYDGKVSISDQHEPDRFVLHAAGAGAPGTVSADVLVTLTADGERTKITYDADAVVGGVLGGVGQRMIATVARKTAGEFFGNVEDVLTGRVSAARPGEPPEHGDGESGVWVAPVRPSRLAGLAGLGGAAGVAPVAAGALAALLGVCLGWVLGRQRR